MPKLKVGDVIVYTQEMCDVRDKKKYHQDRDEINFDHNIGSALTVEKVDAKEGVYIFEETEMTLKYHIFDDTMSTFEKRRTNHWDQKTEYTHSSGWRILKDKLISPTGAEFTPEEFIKGHATERQVYQKLLKLKKSKLI